MTVFTFAAPIADAEWTSDFSSPSGWTIIGTKFSIGGGVLTGTSVDRNTNEIVKTSFDAAREFNVSIKMTLSSFPSGGLLHIAMFDGSPTSYTSTWALAHNYTKFDVFYSSGVKISGNTREAGVNNDTASATISTGTQYTLNMQRLQNPGNNTWKAVFRVWSSAGSYASPNILSGTLWYSGTPAGSTYFVISNENTGSSGYAWTGTFDDFALSTVFSGSTAPAITTLPLMTAIVGRTYYYDADCSLTNPTYSIQTNASFLSIGSSTGNVTGTPSAPGVYTVQITATNATKSVTQTYELRVLSHLYEIDNGNPSPYTNYFSVAYQDRDRIYVAYLGDAAAAAGDVYVAMYDGQAWSDPVKIAANPADATHGGPAITMSLDGRIHVFFGSHESTMKHAVSNSPRDISSWSVSDLVTGATYETPWVDPDTGKMYVFYRYTVSSGSHYDFKYVTSTDNGKTWTSPVTFIDWDSGQAPYVQYNVNKVNGKWRMDISWCVHDYTLNKRINAYYAYMDLSTGSLYSASGTSLGTDITKAEATSSCMVFDSSGMKVYFPAPTSNLSTGAPVVVFATEKTYGWRYVSARWSGSTWTMQEVSEAYSTWWCLNIVQDANRTLLYTTDFRPYGGYAHNAMTMYRYDWVNDTWTMVGQVANKQIGEPYGIGGFGVVQPVVNSTCRMVTFDGTGTEPNAIYFYSDLYGFIIDGTEFYTYPENPENPQNVPSAPLSLSAEESDHTIVLTWSPPADDGGSSVTGYKVYRSINGSSYALLATLGTVLTYTDNNSLVAGTNYSYKVTAINQYGEGDASAAVTVLFEDKETMTDAFNAWLGPLWGLLMLLVVLNLVARIGRKVS